MQKSGIYIIYSRQFPERIYVGSAVNLVARKSRHFLLLRRGNHFNAKLQNHANRYGIEDLLFSVVQVCSPVDLLQFEQKMIDNLRPFFNINPTAGSRFGSKHTVQTKLKMQRSFYSRPPIPIASRFRKYLPK